MRSIVTERITFYVSGKQFCVIAVSERERVRKRRRRNSVFLFDVKFGNVCKKISRSYVEERMT